VKIHLLRSHKNDFQKTFDRSKFHGKFDRIIFGTGATQVVEKWDDWTKLLSDDSHVWFELIEFLHVCDLETKKEIRTKIGEFVKKFQDLTEIEYNEILSKNGPHHLHFIKKKLIEIVEEGEDLKRIE